MARHSSGSTSLHSDLTSRGQNLMGGGRKEGREEKEREGRGEREREGKERRERERERVRE